METDNKQETKLKEGINSSQEKKDKNKDQNHTYQWQKKLLIWIIAMPTLLIFAFMYISTVQVNSFNKEVYEDKLSAIDDLIDKYEMKTSMDTKTGDLDYLRWATLAKMEEESLTNRYKQGGLLLLSRIFTKYLGFLTGMIMAIVGSVFIIGKFSEDVTEISGTVAEKIKFSLMSSSPGIIFGVLGTALMLSTILAHHDIEVKDQPLYLAPATVGMTYLSEIDETGNKQSPKPVRKAQIDEFLKRNKPKNDSIQ